MSNSLSFAIPELATDIRCTEDGRASVYDMIGAIGQQKNPYEFWKRLIATHPEVLTKCENFKFPGRGQRETPVTDFRGWLYILALLPGAMGKQYREDAAQLVTRYMKGDQELINEIKDRQPFDLELDINQQSSPSIAQAREYSKYVLELLENVTLSQSPTDDRNFKVAIAVSATQAHLPEFAAGLEPVKQALAPSTDSKEVYLTPTALGQRLGISARKMNSRLKMWGLQVKNKDYSAGQPAWLPTESGKEYSIITVEEHKGDNPTQYQHLKWSERVLELFKNPMAG